MPSSPYTSPDDLEFITTPLGGGDEGQPTGKNIFCWSSNLMHMFVSGRESAGWWLLGRSLHNSAGVHGPDCPQRPPPLHGFMRRKFQTWWQESEQNKNIGNELCCNVFNCEGRCISFVLGVGVPPKQSSAHLHGTGGKWYITLPPLKNTRISVCYDFVLYQILNFPRRKMLNSIFYAFVFKLSFFSVVGSSFIKTDNNIFLEQKY